MAKIRTTRQTSIPRAVFCFALTIFLAGCGSFITSTFGTTFPKTSPANAKGKAGGPGQPDDAKLAPANIKVSEFPLDAVVPTVKFRSDDQIHFAVYEHPELTYDATVEPDGKASFPLVGTVEAAGFTPDELQKKIAAAVEAKLATTRVVLKPGDSFTMTVWQQPDLTRTATVQLDGRAALPLVGEIRAANRPIADIQREVQAKLHAQLESPIVSILPDRLALNNLANAEISILPLRLAARNVAVIGEVQNAGLVPIHSQLRLVSALAQAKPLDTAELNDVIVIRHMPDGNPGYRSLRVSSFVRGKALGQDIELQDDDLVIVPKTTIAAIDLFVNQFFLQTVGVFYWWIELQQARVAIDAANEITLLNNSLRLQQGVSSSGSTQVIVQ